MPLTSTQRNQIASYKVRLEGLRKDLNTLKEEKKRKSQYYAERIKSTSDANYKRTLRQSKISDVNSIVNRIENKKREIESVKTSIQSIRR